MIPGTQLIEGSDRPADPSRNTTPGQSVSLQTYALAAIARYVVPAVVATDEPQEIQYLRRCLAAASQQNPNVKAALTDYLQHPLAADSPLLALAEYLSLTTVEVLAIALVTAVEEEMMLGRVLAHVQAPVGGSRPTLGLLATAFSDITPTERRTTEIILGGAAMHSGLLTLLGEGQPLPERTVCVPLHLCLALRGQDNAFAGTTIGLDSATEIPLPPSILTSAEKQAAGLRAAEQRVLLLRARSIAEGKSVAQSIAQFLGCRPLFIETEKTTGLSPWLRLRHLLPVFCLTLAPGERRVIPALPLYRGPVLALCGPDGSVESNGSSVLSWTLPVPTRTERETLWQTALGNQELAADLARHHRHGSGRIAHLGRLAQHQCTLAGNDQPTRSDVTAVSWSCEGGGLESLAEPVTDEISDDTLVVSKALRDELRMLLLRCYTRDSLVEGLGASATARYRPGVRALFVGPSGTGKTLAAAWLATKLGLPLYRVDLASITSKYIGETEKNLAQLLARAEQSEVILLFDEADSLFGKRTDIREANDRFANAQTNYLLQRIETYDGITLLTSNSKARFDSAFTRRLDLVIDFPVPGPEERRALWHSHLGTSHQLTPREINQLAVTANLCGGHIRNIVLAAAVLAQNERRPIVYTDVLTGMQNEYRKLGQQVPNEFRVNF